MPPPPCIPACGAHGYPGACTAYACPWVPARAACCYAGICRYPGVCIATPTYPGIPACCTCRYPGVYSGRASAAYHMHALGTSNTMLKDGMPPPAPRRDTLQQPTAMEGSERAVQKKVRHWHEHLWSANQPMQRAHHALPIQRCSYTGMNICGVGAKGAAKQMCQHNQPPLVQAYWSGAQERVRHGTLTHV